MTLQPDAPSSRIYELDAEVTRRRLAANLSELSNRLTPGQVFDEMLTYARGGGGTFFRALTNASRESPIPTLLIGAGCMMFLSEKMGLSGSSGGVDRGASARDAMSSTRGMADETLASSTDAGRRAAGSVGSAARSMSDTARSAAEAVNSSTGNATDYIGEQASIAAHRVRAGASAAGDTLSSAAQSARETGHDLRARLSEAGEQVRRSAEGMADAAQQYGGQMSERAEAARRSAAAGMRRAGDGITNFVQEQPMLSAAIGLALGAAIAALLPKTESENAVMGTTSDAVKQAAGDVASEQFQAAKEAGARVAREAMNVAEQQGLTPAAAVDAARQVGEKVKTVVTETGAAGTSEARDFATSKT
jgi:Protein of unknown function (DUF3618)